MNTEKYRPCPFCQSTRLRSDTVVICHDDGEEDVGVVECLECDAQARAELWNGKRTMEVVPACKTN